MKRDEDKTKAQLINELALLRQRIAQLEASETERKRAEAERSQAEQNAHLASHLTALNQMASGIAHEINNPLTGVIGYAQLLMYKDIPQEAKEDAKTIYGCAQRVATVVKKLLAFTGQAKLRPAYVNINPIIQTTLTVLAHELASNKIRVTTHLDPELPKTSTDAAQLQVVFLSLITNAETEMKLAHGKGDLFITTQVTQNVIRISFKDNGPGIAKKHLDRIFEPFFTTRKVGHGTGLGLSVCHRIITEHGGRIYATSELDKGATFTVDLPIVTKPE